MDKIFNIVESQNYTTEYVTDSILLNHIIVNFIAMSSKLCYNMVRDKHDRFNG